MAKVEQKIHYAIKIKEPYRRLMTLCKWYFVCGVHWGYYTFNESKVTCLNCKRTIAFKKEGGK